MPFRVVSAEPESATGFAISSVIEKIEDALGFALVLTEHSLEVLRIEDAAGSTVKDADEVQAWCAAQVRRRTGP